MILPDRSTFLSKAKPGMVIPVYTEILADTETPVTLFQKTKEGSYAFLLESVESGVNSGRFSIIGLEPKIVFRSQGRQVTMIEDGVLRHEASDDPLVLLEKTIKKYSPVDPADNSMKAPDVPFWGGAVGYVGYDYVRFVEKIPDNGSPSLGTPDLFFTVMKSVVVYDQWKHKIIVIRNAFIDADGESVYSEACAGIEKILERIQGPFMEKKLFFFTNPGDDSIKSSFTREGFCDSVEKMKDHIRAGDIFQGVLSQRFETSLNVNLFDVYRALRVVNPSPYMFHMHLDDIRITGSSPEVMVRKSGDTILLRPIAGTRPRGKDDVEDAALEKELLADEKERAEHLMLVDLGRNDLGRIALKGTVAVEKFMVIEKYSHVMHIVSTVTGQAPGDLSFSSLIRATFPAGTVTGAPKIRAMEIIEDLEPVRRELYAGLVGYFSFTGNFDSCITIRTVWQKGDRMYVQAGAGIVADSHPEKEFDESKNKAQAIFRAIEMARGGLQ